MSKTAAWEAFYEVWEVLSEKLGYLLDFPTTTKGLQPIVDAFAMQGMPNCCGVIGSTHFLIEKSSDHDIGADYYDFSANYSIGMQVVVDGQGRFLDISAGWPGSIPPASVLEKTGFFSRVESSELLHSVPVECFQVWHCVSSLFHSICLVMRSVSHSFHLLKKIIIMPSSLPCR
jgi:hypothetical protein